MNKKKQLKIIQGMDLMNKLTPFKLNFDYVKDNLISKLKLNYIENNKFSLK